MGLMLGCGSVAGYFIAKWDLQTNAIANSQQAIAEPDRKPKQVSLKPPPSKRSLLEEKYHLCIGANPNTVNLSRFDDKTLNDLVFQSCSQTK